MTRWTTAALVCACLALAACGGSDPVDDAGDSATSPDTLEGSEPIAPPDLSSEDQARMADQQSALADCMAERGYDMPDMGNGPGAPGGGDPGARPSAPPPGVEAPGGPSAPPGAGVQDEGFAEAMQACAEELDMQGGLPGGGGAPSPQQ